MRVFLLSFSAKNPRHVEWGLRRSANRETQSYAAWDAVFICTRLPNFPKASHAQSISRLERSETEGGSFLCFGNQEEKTCVQKLCSIQSGFPPISFRESQFSPIRKSIISLFLRNSPLRAPRRPQKSAWFVRVPPFSRSGTSKRCFPHKMYILIEERSESFRSGHESESFEEDYDSCCPPKDRHLLPANDSVASSRLFEQVRWAWILPKPGGWLGRGSPSPPLQLFRPRGSPQTYGPNFWRPLPLR